ncbi:ATP-binding protein [Endozoicomonadaceae bacterium StTr2]
MSTSIRQKITLFTVIPAIVFYSLVTVIYLYFTYRAASVEISRRHLHQSLQYAAVIDGNIKEVLIAARAMQLQLASRELSDNEVSDYLNDLFEVSKVVTGVGISDVYGTKQSGLSRAETLYWSRESGSFFNPTHSLPFSIPFSNQYEALDAPADQPVWFTDTDSQEVTRFRTSLLLPLANERLLRVDIDGRKLTQPLVWLGSRTRLIILNRQEEVVYANGISMPRMRHLEPFITSGPCDGASKINVTSETGDLLKQFIASPIQPCSKKEPCGIFREALQRVVNEGQSINFRVSIRDDRKWVTATPIPSTHWYLSISILEEDILAPLMRHVVLSISLILLAMVFTLGCLWTVSGRITRPLIRLKKEMNAYAGSRDNNEPDSPDEAVSLNRSFLELKHRLAERDQALQHARANNMGHLVQQLRGNYFYFNLSRQGEIIFVSPSICSVLGYELGEFSGQIQSFFTKSTMNFRFANTLDSLSAGVWQEPFEVEMRHRDGTARRVELFCTSHDNIEDKSSQPDTRLIAIEGMGNDITHRVRDTDKFRALVAGSPDATVIINKEGIIGLVNDKTLKLFSYENDELVNMPLSLLVAPQARENLPLTGRVGQPSPESFCLDSYLSRGLTRNGREFPIELSSNVLDTSDGVLISIVFRDISERVRIQAELVDARDQAERASQAKSMFLSNISHELRTPLNGVLGYAQLLLADKHIPERYLGNLKLLEECGLHLLTLINDILDLTKIESSGIEIDPQPFDLRATLNTVVANIRETAVSKRLEIGLEVDSDIAFEVLGDHIKLRQVLINLAGNAVKFTDKGAVCIRVCLKDQHLVFEVCDTGIGISASDQKCLFKSFSQLKSGKQQGGSGLGLAISYRLVNAMGGELQVTSQLQQGSTFFFSIPYQPVSGEVTTIRKPLPEDNQTTMILPQKNISLLVVDDCFNNRNFLIDALSQEHFNVDSAESGREAIALCQQKVYDLILMDIRMPDIDGIEATKAIHQIPSCQSVKIIAISASVSDQTQQNIQEAGFSEFVSKPVHLESLLALIRSHLCKSDDTEVEQRCKEMIARLKALLDIGDIQALLELAQKWQATGIHATYAEHVIRCCETLDIQSIEAIVKELEQL